MTTSLKLISPRSSSVPLSRSPSNALTFDVKFFSKFAPELLFSYECIPYQSINQKKSSTKTLKYIHWCTCLVTEIIFEITCELSIIKLAIITIIIFVIALIGVAGVRSIQ